MWARLVAVPAAEVAAHGGHERQAVNVRVERVLAVHVADGGQLIGIIMHDDTEFHKGGVQVRVHVP